MRKCLLSFAGLLAATFAPPVLAQAVLAQAAPPASAGSASAAQPQREALRGFVAQLDKAAAAPDFVGFAVAVVHNGQIEMIRTYGVREAGTTNRVTPDTAFRLASVSKGFASTLAAMEVKDHKFSLTDPVSATVPQFQLKNPADTASVTVEDILTQRTGLPAYAYDNLLESGLQPLEILARYVEVAPLCKPGDCFAYQNTTYNMIASVIEKATGYSYVDELHRRLLNPLGLRTASFGLAGLMATGDWAVPHVRVKNGWKPTKVKQPYYLLPAAGGMNASITDLAKWLVAQMGYRPDILPLDVIDEVTRPRVETPTETRRVKVLKMPVSKTQYALGWRNYVYAKHLMITHTGSVEGYFSQIAYVPDMKIGLVVLSNTRGSRVTKIMPTWMDYELGLPKTDWFRLGDLQDKADAASD